MITSKLTTKSQTTLPQAVRKALRLQPGDEIEYVIEGDRVVVTKHHGDIFDNPFATFWEWDTEADHEAYDKL